MKRILSSILFCLLTFSAWAQYSTGQTKGGMEELVQRLTAFGKTIPQEKVYVHMDNTCYFLGDTIWFSAYTRQTNTNEPSKVSGVLYVELYNNDGYLVERKLIEMDEGRGKGFFALNNFVQYSGFYELRAYTRWQLNWGLFEHKHSKAASKWFLSNELQRNFYRDYDKLYSRVFPVYDKPADQMHPERNMTSRVMRRYFNKDMDEASRKLSLTLFPEGGNLVAGVENRVAFEAAMSDGEQLEGILTVGNEEVKAVNRGRGMFTLIPEKGMELEVTFTAKDGQRVSVKLPKPEEKGVAVQVKQLGDSIIIISNVVGIAPESLAMTVMHEGKVEEFEPIHNSEFTIHNTKLEAGIHQVTVFDTQGQVWADRLFFVTKPELATPTLAISRLKDEYKPYERIEMEVTSTIPEKGIGGGLSLAVRDNYQGETLYDNGNIMTEMLLASEIKGFIPNPGWYFEKDDEEHRTALDLLMMTQGWRRFVWKDMAVKGEWDLTQPNEKTPIITGKVWKNNMSQLLKDIDYKTPFDRTIMEIERMQERNNRNERKDNVLSKSEESDEKKKEDNPEEASADMNERKEDDFSNQEASHEKMNENIPEESSINMNDITKSKGKLKREVKVHGELIHLLYNRGVVKETETKDGFFRMTLPHFYGNAVFFLSASDTTKWKKGKKYEWVKMTSDDNDDEWKDIMKVTGVLNGANVNISLFRNYVRAYLDQPEFFVRVSFPYPHFVKPYNYYQKNLQPSRDESGKSTNLLLQDNTRDLKEINVHARFGGKRRFDDSQPAFIMDYEEAQNMFDDAGMFGDFGRVFVGDYGLEHPYIATSNVKVKEDRISRAMPSNIYYSYGLSATQRTIKGIPNDSVYSPKYLSSQGKGIIYQDSIPNEYWDDFVPSKIENVLVYSDYCPRQEGDKRYWASNLPETRIVMYPFTDGSRRVQYRDRYYTLPGFSYPAEFYNPDYSQQTPPEPNDYRRTLYWNPNLQLDENGQARITFYNNSRTTQISVEAEGQASDGTLLWSK